MSKECDSCSRPSSRQDLRVTSARAPPGFQYVRCNRSALFLVLNGWLLSRQPINVQRVAVMHPARGMRLLKLPVQREADTFAAVRSFQDNKVVF